MNEGGRRTAMDDKCVYKILCGSSTGIGDGAVLWGTITPVRCTGQFNTIIGKIADLVQRFSLVYIK